LRNEGTSYMDQLTLVFTDGHIENFRVTSSKSHDSSLNMLYFKQLIENDMLKLIVNKEQIQLIPLLQLRKIIIGPVDGMHQHELSVTGFIHVTVDYPEVV